MSKINKIVVATDLSPLSFIALRKGVELAQARHAQLIVLHVLERASFLRKIKKAMTLTKHHKLHTEDAVRQIIEDQLGLLKNKAKTKIEIVKNTRTKIAANILHYIKKNRIQLMLIGAHGRYSLFNFLVGTTTEQIVAKVNCPVFVIKNTKPVSYKKILLPVDFSKASGASLQFAREFFPDSHLCALYVADQAYNVFMQSGHMQAYVMGRKIKKEILFLLTQKIKSFVTQAHQKIEKISTKVIFGFPAVVILKEAESKQFSLVIMGMQGHNKRHYDWLGRVSNRVLGEIEKDILLVPPGISSQLRNRQSKSQFFVANLNEK